MKSAWEEVELFPYCQERLACFRCERKRGLQFTACQPVAQTTSDLTIGVGCSSTGLLASDERW